MNIKLTLTQHEKSVLDRILELKTFTFEDLRKLGLNNPGEMLSGLSCAGVLRQTSFEPVYKKTKSGSMEISDLQVSIELNKNFNMENINYE